MEEGIGLLSVTLFERRQIYGLKEFLGDRDEMGSIWDNFETQGYQVFPVDKILIKDGHSFYSLAIYHDDTCTVIISNEEFQAIAVPLKTE